MSDTLITGKMVLVADDNAINQMVVKHALLTMGADAEIVNNGTEAIEKFKNNKYDIVLMDIQMPLMNGYETTAYIRNQLASNVPIIAMTAFALNGENEKCFECGMNGYIAKPFTMEELANVIEKVLSVPGEVAKSPYVVMEQNIVVDMSMLYDISGDDESYIHLMLQTFVENMPKTIQKIEQSFFEKDWEGVYRSAHYAKSSLSIIKVSEMFEAVLLMEKNSKKTENLDEIPVLIQKVKEAFLVAKEIILKKMQQLQVSL